MFSNSGKYKEIRIIALCGYPLVKMELEIQTRFLPRLPFFQDTIISDNTFGMNIWFSFTFNIFSGQDDYSIFYPDSDSDSAFSLVILLLVMQGPVEQQPQNTISNIFRR